MKLFSALRIFDREFAKVHLKHRAMPLAALALTTSMTVPVLAAGVDVYQISDGITTECVSVFRDDAQYALAQSSFDAEEYTITSVSDAGDNLYQVTVKEKYDVSITADGKTVTHHTGDHTVDEIIRQAGIELNDADIIVPARDTKITEPTAITITRVTKVQKTETRPIAYTTQTKNTDALYRGESRVAQKGVNGTEELTFDYIYHDGKQVSRHQVGSRVIAEPVTQIVEKGTKKPSVPGKGGLSYSRVLTVEATAYSGGGRTASGTRARVGAIAVDPRVIPLGTRLYITSMDGKSWVYGYAVAEDTGGAIKGNRIDLYFNSESQCRSFGRRNCKVYVLD